MSRLFRPFLCPALLLLAMLAPPTRAFPEVAMGTGTDSVRVAQRDKSDRKRVPERLIRGESVNCPGPAPAAEPLDPPTTSAFSGAKKFPAGKHFKENIAPSADVRIGWLGATFTRRFAVKIEDMDGDTIIQFHTLLRASRDRPIIEELDDRHETRLVDLWCLLKIQANGEPGPLLIDAAPNIFYVRDGSGVLGAVDAVWGGAGWEIGASPADGERTWPAGARVMSR